MLNPEVNASQRGNIARISTVEAPDDLTVVFTLSSPYADLPIMLGYNVGIVPKHLLDGQDLNEPTAFLQQPIGTGPFKYKEFSAGDFLSVEANPDYFDGAPHLESIIFKIVPDGNARVAQAQSGEIDLAIVEPPQVEALSGSESATVREVPQVQYYFFAVNHTSTTMQNVLVRQALSTAIDKDAIVNELLGGYGAVATGPINPLLAEFYTAEVTTYPYDLEAAGALLDEAGWTLDGDKRVNASGAPLTIVINGPQGYPTLEQVLIYAQQQWEGLGVTVELIIDEWTVHLEKYRTQDYDLLLNWWITPPDAGPLRALPLDRDLQLVEVQQPGRRRPHPPGPGGSRPRRPPRHLQAAPGAPGGRPPSHLSLVRPRAAGPVEPDAGTPRDGLPRRADMVRGYLDQGVTGVRRLGVRRHGEPTSVPEPFLTPDA